VRRWSEPVELVRVIRATSAEIEDYTRVGILHTAEVRVAGHAVSDVVHLLAELIENAATFSPPATRVQVTGEPAAHGYLLEIEDQGIGMTPAELEEANQQLATPAAVGLEQAGRLGFYVVGRLAARHGIKVRLRRSWFGGVAALVLLPASLLSGPPEAGGPTIAGVADGEPQHAQVPSPVPRAFAVADQGGHDDATPE
jgi:signal transduction histidine kinase